MRTYHEEKGLVWLITNQRPRLLWGDIDFGPAQQTFEAPSEYGDVCLRSKAV